MEKYSTYKGGIEVISGFKQKNNGSFFLVDDHDVQSSEDGISLHERLRAIDNKLSEVESTTTTVVDDGDGNVAIVSLSNNLSVSDDDNGVVTILV